MTSLVSCSGEISTESGFPVCSGLWQSVVQQPPFDPTQLDLALLGQAFAAGFSIVATLAVIAMGIRAFVNFIKTS